MALQTDTVSIAAGRHLADREAVAWAIALLSTAVLEEERSSGIASIALQLVEPSSPEAPAGTPRTPESFAMRIGAGDGVAARRVLIAGTDDRGFAYAITELADRVRAGGAEMEPGTEVSDQPAVPVRSIQRTFSSVDEDLPWFHDRAFWSDYLDHLASQRFNRFQLAFGMQYNYGTGWESRTATDNYLCFAYPFLLDVPGHRVRAQGVPPEERARNLASLAFIAREVRRRGMHFQLGLWNHAYDYGFESPHRFPILGVSEENHASYSADALRLLLETIPEIDGLTFRVHHEGGIHEEGHEIFWGTVFEAASQVGRDLEIDMHAKGVDDALVQAARRPNLRAVISGKYWAEHMGLPYHQASIRPRERTPLRWGGADQSMTGVTNGARRFTRYGFADFLSEERPIEFMFRMWPGTQKLLMWGDPAIAAGFGRYATIGGSRGLELCEPMTFKGRKGTGERGGRDVYVDDELRLDIDDWRKHSYAYLLWGRLLYAPDAPREVWQRHLRREHGASADAIERGLAPLSRILPLVTVVHGVSGANNFYWPEVYVDLAISFWKQSFHYAFDLEEPRTWEGVSPFDPTMFSSVSDYVDELLADSPGYRYTPIEVATWIDRMVEDGERALGDELTRESPQTRRARIDGRILAELGRFFAGKLRAATAYVLSRRTGDVSQMEIALAELEAAHSAYARIAEIADGVYRADLAFGVGASERGSWKDRLPAMREDRFLVSREFEQLRATSHTPDRGFSHRRERSLAALSLVVPERFERGAPMPVRLEGDDARVVGAVLHFRRLNHAEEWASIPMERASGAWLADVPASCTDSTYPVTVFAQVKLAAEPPVIVPAFDADLSNQPYRVVHSTVWRGDS